MINELLESGEENARTATELARILNLDERDIRHYVRKERLRGTLICSSCKGYFLPANNEEIRYTISRLYCQGRENIRVADALQSALDKG